MQSKSLGLILNTKPINDNNLYIKVLSVNDNILSGLVYGGNTSKKISIYQPGYFLEFNQIQKNSNSVNSITGEIVGPYIGNIYNDKFKTFSLLAIISILNESIYQGVKTNGLFISVKNLIIFISENNSWLSYYCEWLLHFLQLLGYGIDYNNKLSMKYFNLNLLNFQKVHTSNNSILFPHKLFNKNCSITYESVKSFFIIFESVFKKNNINNFNEGMPINYLNFKNLVKKSLKKIINE